VAATDVPVSIVLESDLKEEDLEQMQHEVAATQKKIADEAKSRWMQQSAYKKKWLDWEKKQAKDKTKKEKAEKDVEEAWKSESQRVAKEVSPGKLTSRIRN